MNLSVFPVVEYCDYHISAAVATEPAAIIALAILGTVLSNSNAKLSCTWIWSRGEFVNCFPVTYIFVSNHCQSF
jgi:hypothetical protein